MIKRFFSLGLMILLAIGAWADVDFGTEEVVSETTTWTFNNYTTGDHYSGNSSWNVTNKLYSRSISSRKFTIIEEMSSTNLSFDDGFEVSISKYAESSSAVNIGSGSTVRTAGTSGTSDTTPAFSFNAPTAGTCYAIFKGIAANGSIKASQCRLYFSDGTAKPASKKSVTITDESEYAKIHWTSTGAGSYYVTSADNTCKIYAIRFVPETINTPSISQDGNSVTITSGTSSITGTTITTYYTTDGSDPTSSSTPYTGVISITENCTIKAISISSGGASSDVASKTCEYTSTATTLTSDNVSVASVTYNGSEQTAVVKYNETTNLVEGTDYNVSEANSNKGTNAGDYTFSITGKGNYTGTVSNLTFTITPKEVTVTGGITANNKDYDGNTTATLVLSNATIDGKVGDDALTVASATGTFADANVGENKEVTISNITFGGTKAGNYTLSASGNQASTTATITQATNALSGILTINNWYSGKTRNMPTGVTATFGTVEYKYADAENGTYGTYDNIVNGAVGTWYVKAYVKGTDNYTYVESAPVSFNIIESETVTAPTIRNNNGTITITAGTSSKENSVKTYYTIDGIDPTASSTEYTNPFSQTTGATIKAITISLSNEAAESAITSKTVPTIPTALSANTVSFAGLTSSDVIVDDADNFEEGTYKTNSANASALYINDVSFCYSTENRVITFGANYTTFSGPGLTITIPGLTAGEIVVLSSSSNNSAAVNFTCSSGGTILSGSTTSIQTTPTNLVVQSTGGNMVLTTAKAGLRLYSINIAQSLTVAVNAEQTAMGIATITSPLESDATALGDGYYVKGSSITLTATPNDGYYFVNWTNGSGNAVSTDATYTFELNEDLALTANFAAKTGSSVTTPPSANNLTYNQSAQQLINTESVACEGGTMKYCMTMDGEYTADATTITGTDAGTYTVYYKVVGDYTHSDTEPVSIEVTIAKATLTLEGTLTATADYGTKLSEISNFNGTVKIADTDITVTGTWAISGEDVLNVGEHTGYNAVFTPTQAEGKDNYNELAAQNVSTLTITAVAATITTAPTGATSLVYNGSPQQIINATNATCDGGVLWYCETSNGEYTTDASTITETNAGTYTFYYKVVADGNHTGIDPTQVTGIKIAKYNISNAVADAAIADQSYTGSQITPDAPAIKMVETTIDASNYEVTYGENVAAGDNAGSIIYTAKNESQNYKGTKTLSFNITKADLTFNGTLSATAAYGTAVKDIPVTTADNVTFGETVIAGTWSFSDSDNDVLQVGNTTAKTATFLPSENPGNYNALTREVIPTITAVALTIKAQNQVIWEGETISQDVSQVEVTGLVNGETLTSIKLTASTTEITENGIITPSDAVISSSANNYTITYETGNLTIKQIPTYTITGVADDGNGNSVTADATTAREGATITLTITTADTYTLTSISATGVTLGGSGNTRTFTMPAANVTITAAFTQTSTIDETTQITENVNKKDENHAEVTSVEIGASTTSVSISGSVDGVPVTSIAATAFDYIADKSEIKSIDLSATSITGVAVSRSSGVFNGFPEETMIYMPTGNTAEGQKNVVIDGTCANFEMANEKSYNIPSSFTATYATLSRSFTNRTTCTVCLPYAVPAATIASLGKIYYFSGISGTTVQMTEQTEGLVANTPYIFVPSSNASQITATSVTINMSSTPNTSPNGQSFIFKGVYEHKDFTTDEISGGIYGFAADADHGASSVGQFVKASNGAWIEGMRAYLAYGGDDLTGTASTRGEGLPDVLNVVLIHANGSTTNIGRLELMTAEDGSPIYNLSGQRVENSYKGLVIKNGKKVVIK